MNNKYENTFFQTDKKYLKEKILKDNIFHEITIYNNEKENDISSKINNIKIKEINNLKLIDIRLIHRNLHSFQKSENNTTESSTNRSKSFFKTFKNKISRNKNKEIKILPYISSSNKNRYIYKPTEKKNIINSNKNSKEKKNLVNNNIKIVNKIKNNDRKKLFMTKIHNNIKNIPKYNNFKAYSYNIFNSPQYNKGLDDNNKKSQNLNFNQTFNKRNKGNLLNLKENSNLETIIKNNKLLDNKRYEIKNTENKIYNREKEDFAIYELLKKNKELEKKYKMRQSLNGSYAYKSNFMDVNKRNISKNLKKLKLNKIENKKYLKTENNSPVKNNNIYTSQLNLTEQNEINSNGLNMDILNNYIYNNNKINLKNINTDINFNDLINNNEKLFIDIINLLQDSNIKFDLLKDIKNKEKLKRLFYIIKVNNLEQDFNDNYEKTNNTFRNRNIFVKRMKKKCKDILEDLDKRINFNLEEFIKDFERKDLGINFAEFFNYLMIILVNYDKKIVPNTFEIKKEPNQIREELKYKNVLRRHNAFMNLLDKLSNEGKNMDKLLDKYILKRKEEIEMNNSNNIINNNKI